MPSSVLSFWTKPRSLRLPKDSSPYRPTARPMACTSRWQCQSSTVPAAAAVSRVAPPGHWSWCRSLRRSRTKLVSSMLSALRTRAISSILIPSREASSAVLCSSSRRLAPAAARPLTPSSLPSFSVTGFTGPMPQAVRRPGALRCPASRTRSTTAVSVRLGPTASSRTMPSFALACACR